jgi:hypothetical protein
LDEGIRIFAVRAVLAGWIAGEGEQLSNGGRGPLRLQPSRKEQSQEWRSKQTEGRFHSADPPFNVLFRLVAADASTI